MRPGRRWMRPAGGASRRRAGRWCRGRGFPGCSSSLTRHLSRLTAAAVIDLINAARTEILLVSYATHSEPSIKAALSAATARNVAVTLLAERHEDNPSYTAAGTPFSSLNMLRLH